MTTVGDRHGLFDEDHDAFRQTVRRFMAAEAVPNLDEWRAAGGVSRPFLRAAGEHGFLGMAVPEELGGGGVHDARFAMVFVEEAAHIGAIGLAMTVAMECGVCLPLLLRHADADQQARWLPGLASGEHLAAAISAPIQADAQQHRLTGSRDAVTGAAHADLLVTAFYLKSEAPQIALLAADSDGLVRRPVTDALGAGDAGQADLRFDSVSVPQTGLLAGRGADQLQDIRQVKDLWLAVLGVASARAILSWTVDYVRQRRVFGRAVAEFDNTRQRVAEIAAELTTVQVFVDTCMRAHLEGGLAGPQAASARLCAEALHDRAVDQGLQLHGGYGYMREYPIAQAFADARYLRLEGKATGSTRETIAAGLGL